MSPQLLRETRPTARKLHECSTCSGLIPPGDAYYRRSLVFDDRVYDWLECTPCDDDDVVNRAYLWGVSVDGVDADHVMEWATEQVIHGSPDDQRAAKNFLERWHVARGEEMEE